MNQSFKTLRQDSASLSADLLHFIETHPSVFHVIAGQKEELLEAGYEELAESADWKLRKGGRYFVTRSGSALIAFRIPAGECRGFMMMASHADSPTFRIKANPEMTVDGTYKKLNVEVYGGALLHPWFDRPLSAAGRVFVRTPSGVRQQLVSIDRDLLLIPSLAIHMDREANKGRELKVQKDLLPLYGLEGDPALLSLIAEECGIDEETILSHDLYLYNRQKPSVWGASREYMSAPRLDDLACAFASLKGFLAAEKNDTGTETACGSIPVHVVFDNEEVGSLTRQGAESDFLVSTLGRICDALNRIGNESSSPAGDAAQEASPTHAAVPGASLARMAAESFMLSADNAHSLHPNYPEKCDPVNHPKMGGGVVLKYSGSQKYATDAASAAVAKWLAARADVSLQEFTNHSDIPGGSTLGNIAMNHLGIRTADIGMAQLAMHSPYETASVKDLADLTALAAALYSSSLTEEKDGEISLD